MGRLTLTNQNIFNMIRQVAVLLILTTVCNGKPQSSGRIVGMTTWVGRGLGYQWISTRTADLQLFDNKKDECSQSNLKIVGATQAPGVRAQSGRYTFIIHENGDCSNPGQPMFVVSRSCGSCSAAVGFMTLASNKVLQLDDLEIPETCTAEVLNVNNRAMVVYDDERNSKAGC